VINKISIEILICRRAERKGLKLHSQHIHQIIRLAHKGQLFYKPELHFPHQPAAHNETVTSVLHPARKVTNSPTDMETPNARKRLSLLPKLQQV